VYCLSFTAASLKARTRVRNAQVHLQQAELADRPKTAVLTKQRPPGQIRQQCPNGGVELSNKR